MVEQFAGPLKCAANLLGFHKGGDTDDLYRWFCQTAGQKARERDPRWFVNLMAATLDVHAQTEADRLNEAAHHDTAWHETVILIDDMRFENEKDLVKEYGGKTCFVSAMKRLTDMHAEWRQHYSEDYANAYENGHLNDEEFDMSISNNNPDGEASFKMVVATLAEGLCCQAEEEIK